MPASTAAAKNRSKSWASFTSTVPSRVVSPVPSYSPASPRESGGSGDETMVMYQPEAVIVGALASNSSKAMSREPDTKSATQGQPVSLLLRLMTVQGLPLMTSCKISGEFQISMVGMRMTGHSTFGTASKVMLR